MHSRGCRRATTGGCHGTAPGHLTDAANLTQTTTSATNLVIHTAQWALNLIGLPEFAVAAGSFIQSMATLQQIVADAQALGFDIMSLQAQLSTLFDLSSAPGTSGEFAMRMGEIRFLVMLAYGYAMRTQTLITTTIETVTDAMTLATHVMVVLGVVQGTQAIAQYQQQLLLVQSELKVATTGYYRAKSVEAMTEPMIEQSIRNINEVIWNKEP
jgi:hypothetical protein